MPAVLKKSGAVFLHPMKTGGTWVRCAMTEAGVEWSDEGEGDSHADYHSSLKVSKRGERFTIVRNPFEWYRSFWAFRDSRGWGGSLAIGHACKSRTFDHFILKVTKECPGFLTEYFSRYAAETVIVMRNETLAENLADVLESLGETFDRAKLLGTPPANRSASLPEYAAVRWNQITAGLVVDSEWKLFDQWGWSLEP